MVVVSPPSRNERRGTKPGRDQDDTTKKPDMKLNVPEILKVFLVDDWEAVTKNNQVLTLLNSLDPIVHLLRCSWLPYQGLQP